LIRFFKACSASRAGPSFGASTNQEIDPMKKFAAALLAVALIPTIAACNTVKGVGKDVQAGGEAVEEVAKEVEKEITE
jgi:entericidin B